MDAVLKFIDKMVAGMSSSTMQIIRLGGLLVWLIIATIIVTVAWSYGSESVPPSGQDLSMQTIREKIQKEKNLKNPPRMDIGAGGNVTVPGIGELREDQRSARSFYPPRKQGNELAGDAKKTYPGYVNQNPDNGGDPVRSNEPMLPREERTDRRAGNRAGNPTSGDTRQPSATPFPRRTPSRGTQAPPAKTARINNPPGPAKTKPGKRRGSTPLYQTEKRGGGYQPAFQQ